MKLQNLAVLQGAGQVSYIPFFIRTYLRYLLDPVVLSNESSSTSSGDGSTASQQDAEAAAIAKITDVNSWFLWNALTDFALPHVAYVEQLSYDVQQDFVVRVQLHGPPDDVRHPTWTEAIRQSSTGPVSMIYTGAGALDVVGLFRLQMKSVLKLRMLGSANLVSSYPTVDDDSSEETHGIESILVKKNGFIQVAFPMIEQWC